MIPAVSAASAIEILIFVLFVAYESWSFYGSES